MKDAKALLEKYSLLQAQGENSVALLISAPICSKSQKFLEEQDIEILSFTPQ